MRFFIGFLVFILLGGLGGYVIYLGVTSNPGLLWLGITLVIVAIVYLIIVNLIFNVANQVYNTALFVYADTGSVPKGWKKQVLANTFQPKPEGRR